MRVKTSVPAKAKHNKLLSLAKGYRGNRKKSIKLARQAVLKAGVYSYRDRRNKKRDLRSAWIVTINNALESTGLNYSQFIHKLKIGNVEIDRKIFSQIAKKFPLIFSEVVKKVS